VSVWGDYGEAGEGDREWIILEHIESVYEDSITKFTESYWGIGEQSDKK
jgi:hypothetical protein